MRPIEWEKLASSKEPVLTVPSRTMQAMMKPLAEFANSRHFKPQKTTVEIKGICENCG